MCGICGAIAKDGRSDTVATVLEMLKEMNHRGPDSVGLSWDGGSMTATDLDELLRKAKTTRAPRTLGQARLRITGGDRGLQPFVAPERGISLVFNGEIYNYRALLARLSDGGGDTDTDGEVLFRWVLREHDGDGARAIERTLPELDGVYAVAMMDQRGIYLCRDRVGVKQVYVGENDRMIGFASERKALWRVGMRSHRLNPGEMLRMDASTTLRKRLHSFSVLPIVYSDHERALGVYRSALTEAIRKRVAGHRRVGVLFSGGVDSVLVARVAADLCEEVTGYAGGVPGSPDLTHAEAAARGIGLPLRVKYLDAPMVEKILPATVAAIEDSDLMQVEVALPMYAALSLAREDGIRVMLSGQGADELFAGYEWYPPIFRDRGEKELLSCMWDDICNLYRDTLEREDKMSMAHSIELRVPFLDLSLIREAMMISPSLKIDAESASPDPLRKRLHRDLALSLGVPRDIAMRPKDGAQHGSGIHRFLEGLACARHPVAPPRRLDLDELEQRGSAFRHSGIDVHGDTYGSPEARAYVAEAAYKVFSRVLEAPPAGQSA